ncbi:MAG TPA: hypothetical protein VKY56_10045, partial [Chloroflexota bacterium]|nr:hypothetical protein [Chloroflexota bacterium]
MPVLTAPEEPGDQGDRALDRQAIFGICRGRDQQLDARREAVATQLFGLGIFHADCRFIRWILFGRYASGLDYVPDHRQRVLLEECANAIETPASSLQVLHR